MIIITGGCAAKKDRVASSKFKIIDHTETLFMGYKESLFYQAHNFVLHGGISKSQSKTFVVRENHVASLKVKIIT